MASNGYGNSGPPVYVLYKIVNSEADHDDPHFNAFEMPKGPGRGPTLASVKQYVPCVFVCVRERERKGGGRSNSASPLAYSAAATALSRRIPVCIQYLTRVDTFSSLSD